jgi:uncharacterized protein (DUF433 family)
MTEEADRFEVPLYTVSEAARYLQVPPSTLSTWVDGYVRGRRDQQTHGVPVVTALPRKRPGYPRLPFVGLAEAYVLNAFRKAGVPLQRIRPSLDWLTEHVGAHALASRDLYTDGAEVLWNFAQHAGEGTPDERTVKQLIVPRSGQYVFREVVDQYLRQVTFNLQDGYAALIRLPQYREAEVVVDPCRAFGHPIFAKGGVRVDNVLGSIRAGESFEDVADDYGVPVSELRDAYALSAA